MNQIIKHKKMEGINLSASLEKARKESIIFNGKLVVFLIFFVTLVSWGGMWWYLKMLNDDFAKKTVLLEESSTKLQGIAVDRVVSFDTRLMLSMNQIADDSTNTEALLNQVEKLTLSSVQLTKYEFNNADKSVVIKGETDDFKDVAQQLMNFKTENLFSGMTVESLEKNESGRIVFSFKSMF